MRPLFRGDVPKINGVPKTVSDYKNWRKDLIDRLGPYCCFCNIPLKDSIQVEHVIAQDIDESKRLNWDNMLLACGPCNRSKSNKPCPPTTHYLPQLHNTHLAFTHSPVPILLPRHSNSPAIFLVIRPGNVDSGKANNTINLCCLDRDTTKKADQVTDLRWKFRYEAFLDAVIWKKEWDDWGETKKENFLPLLKTVVEGKGFWSIWFDTFNDVPEVREVLVTGFPGTDQNSFDQNYDPIPRTSSL